MELAQVRPVDPVLTNFGIQYGNSLTDYAADTLFPFTKTDGDTGTYFTADPLNNLKAEVGQFSYTTGATRVESRFNKGTFNAQPFAFEEPVFDAWVKNFTAGGQPLKERATKTVVDKMYLAREVRVEAVADGVAPTVSLSSTARWDSTAANPRLDIRRGSTAIRKRTGLPANGVIFTGSVWDVVIGSTSTGSGGEQVGQGVKYTQGWLGRDMTPELIAAFLAVAIVKPALAIQSDATKFENTTIQTAGLPEDGTYIWDQAEAYIFRFELGQQVVSYGQSFGSDPGNMAVDQYRDDKVKADVVRAIQTVDEKVTCSTALYVLGTIHS